MYYNFHLTTSEERNELINTGKFVWKKITPNDIANLDSYSPDRGKSIVWDEDKKDYYEISYKPILETLEQYDKNRKIPLEKTEYFKYWNGRKGEEYCRKRILRLFETYNSIKEEGFKKDSGIFGGICVERTGGKLDGSHRTIILYHLKEKEMEVKEFVFNWRNITEDFLKRKLIGREMSIGKVYYFIDWGFAKNITSDFSDIYKENSTERWGEILKDTINPGRKTILDLGCSEGYVSIMCAISGAKKVIGIDKFFIDGAFLNKLIFEWQLRKDLNVNFFEGDITKKIPKGHYDIALLLNVIYHLPQESKVDVLRKINADRVILQGNLRKLKEHERFFGITIEDMKKLLADGGWKADKIINWREKPIVIGKR